MVAESKENGIETKKTVCWPSPGCTGAAYSFRSRMTRLSYERQPDAHSKGFVFMSDFPFSKVAGHPDQLMYR